ncbi:MAG: TIGR00725 family protein [Acidimicrobiales bacterium]
MRERPHVAVVGGYKVDADTLASAEEVGRRLATAGAVVVTGGRHGVAEAASRGAAGAGGLTIGILPGRDRAEANPWVQVAVPTGLGDTRNALVVMGADAVIALTGRYGTLSEIAFALLAGTPVVALGSWELGLEGRPDPSIERATDPADAVERALRRSAAG